jgi:hypothetical protein
MAKGKTPPGRGSASGVRRRSEHSLGEYSNGASITSMQHSRVSSAPQVSLVTALQWTGAALTVCRSSASASTHLRNKLRPQRLGRVVEATYEQPASARRQPPGRRCWTNSKAATPASSKITSAGMSKTAPPTMSPSPTAARLTFSDSSTRASSVSLRSRVGKPARSYCEERRRWID